MSNLARDWEEIISMRSHKLMHDRSLVTLRDGHPQSVRLLWNICPSDYVFQQNDLSAIISLSLQVVDFTCRVLRSDILPKTIKYLGG